MVKFSNFLLENKMVFDLIVFDIDGVLLDTSHSFPMAISQAVVHYGKLTGFSHWLEPSLEQVGAFKTIPGFNNDWDLAEAMLVYQLQRELLDQPMDLPKFLRQIDRLNGGLEGIRSWLKQLPKPIGRQFRQAYRSELIRHLAMEYYAGKEYCQILYGFSPEFGIDIGTMHTEISLVDVGLLTRLSQKKGIYTGRLKCELQIALDKIGFSDWQPRCKAFDDGVAPTKPNSKPLWEMFSHCGAKGILFVGDSRDDQTTVENFRKTYHGIPAEFVQILADRDPFAGDFSYVDNVNQFLEFLLLI